MEILLKFNLEDLIFKDLDGNTLPISNRELGKTLGNYIYTSQPDLAWLEIAQELHKGQILELTQEQASALQNLICSAECMLIMPVKLAIKEHINNLLSNLQNDEGNK